MIINGEEYIKTIQTLMEEGNQLNIMTYSLYGEIENFFNLFNKTKSRLIVSIPPYMPCNQNGCQDCFDTYIDNLQNIFVRLDDNNINAKVVIKVHGKMFYSKTKDGYVYSLGSKNIYNSQSLDISFIDIVDDINKDVSHLINIFESEWKKEQLVSFGKYKNEKVAEVIKNNDYFDIFYGIGLDKINVSSLPLLMFLNLRYKNGEKLYL